MEQLTLLKKKSVLLGVASILFVLLSFPVYFVFSSESLKTNNTKKSSFDVNTTYSPTPVRSKADISSMVFAVDSSIQISVVDHLYNPVGYLAEEKPYADPVTGHLGWEKSKNFYYVQKPQTGKYIVKLSSKEEQKYTLDIYLYDNNANVNTFIKNGMVNANVPIYYIVNFDHDESKYSYVSDL